MVHFELSRSAMLQNLLVEELAACKPGTFLQRGWEEGRGGQPSGMC